MPPAPHAPRRELGPLSCLAIGLTTIVGSGIFALPPTLAAALGPLSFLAFLGAAVVVSLIGLMTAEAAGTTERHGGAYEYARLAFGPSAGIAIAWLAWVNLVVSWATVSLALVKLLDVLRPGLGSGQSARWIATSGIIALALINVLGVRSGAALSNLLTVAKLVPLLLFAAIGVLALQPQRFAGALDRLAMAGAGGFAVAVYRCIFAAGGFENIGVVAGDVRDPRRTIPRAVLLAIAGSSLLYALVQLAAVAAVPGLAAGAVVYTVILIGALLSMTGFCAAVAIVAPRYLFAMAGDGFVPAGLLRLSARGTPATAILTVAAIAIAAVWTLDWLTLLDAAVLFSLVQHTVTILAAWRLRRVVPTAGRFVAPGGPLVPVLALLAIAALCALAFRPGAAPGDAVDLRHFAALALVLALGAALAALSRFLHRR